FRIFIAVSICLIILFHLFDFLFSQSRRSLNTDVLRFVCSLIGSAYFNDTVGINIKRYFHLWRTALRWWNTVQVETTDCFVVVRHWALPLQYVDFNTRLLVCRSRENLTFLGRNGCVTFNQFGHYTTHSFNTKGKWGYVQKKHIFHISS